MPKRKNPLSINLNLLKPQGNTQNLPVKLIRWLLSSGRYIFVFVEALVLIAFGARFKLDADLAAKKEAIEEQIPYIESLKPYEILIRNTQIKLTAIEEMKNNPADWSQVMEKISQQVPTSVKVTGITMEKDQQDTSIHISGQTQISSDVSSFASGLKDDDFFKNVSIVSIGLEQSLVKFTIDAQAAIKGGKNL